MTKQRTFAADGTLQLRQLSVAERKGQLKQEPLALKTALLEINPSRIAGPTGDDVLAGAIAQDDYSGVVSMERSVLDEALGRLVKAGRITSEQMAAALDYWDKAHSPAAAAPEPDPEPSPADSWTLMGVTMKKLWWVASGIGAVLLVTLVVKMIVKK